MAFLSELTEYKRQLANRFVNDELLVELLTGRKGTKLPAADLIGKNVYLYDYIDDTVKDAKAIVCIEIDPQDVSSPTARNFELHIYVCVHKDIMDCQDMVKNGLTDWRGNVRRDAICARIDYLLNNMTDMGFQKVEPTEAYRMVFSSDFRTRDMVYRTKDWNIYGEALVR